jgi:hypothetical protein
MVPGLEIVSTKIIISLFLRVENLLPGRIEYLDFLPKW